MGPDRFWVCSSTCPPGSLLRVLSGIGVQGTSSEVVWVSLFCLAQLTPPALFLRALREVTEAVTPVLLLQLLFM